MKKKREKGNEGVNRAEVRERVIKSDGEEIFGEKLRLLSHKHTLSLPLSLSQIQTRISLSISSLAADMPPLPDIYALGFQELDLRPEVCVGC